MRIGFMVFPYQVELPLAEASMGGTASGSAPEASCPLSVLSQDSAYLVNGVLNP